MQNTSFYIGLVLLFMLSCSPHQPQQAKQEEHPIPIDQPPIRTFTETHTTIQNNTATTSFCSANKPQTQQIPAHAPKRKKHITPTALHHPEASIAHLKQIGAVLDPLAIKRQVNKRSSAHKPPTTLPWSQLNQGHSITLYFENDIFDNLDRYYTNGAGIGINHPDLWRWPVARLLHPYPNRAVNSYGVEIIQNLYTPRNPDLKEIIPGDRPFAAYLVIRSYKTSVDREKKLRLTSGLSLGVIGNASMGGRIQKLIHHIEPMGWSHQIANDFIINCDVTLEKSLLSLPLLEFSGSARARVGTLYIDGTTGLHIRLGRFIPLAPISAARTRPINPLPLRYYLFINSQVRANGYDATLQGGLINTNSIYTLPANQINRLSKSVECGIAFLWGPIGVRFSNTWISAEFNGAEAHKWGCISSTFHF